MTMPSAFPNAYAGSTGDPGAGSAPAGGTMLILDGATGSLPGSAAQGKYPSFPPQTQIPPQQGTTGEGILIGPAAQFPGNQINTGGGGVYAAAPQGTATGGGMGQLPQGQGMPSSLNSGPS